MLFKPIMIQQILVGRKTMTRRLVKENEHGFAGGYQSMMNGDNSIRLVTKGEEGSQKQKKKWQVGRKYSVCPGRGKSQIWYCPKCGEPAPKNESINANTGKFDIICGIEKPNGKTCYCMQKPLFVELVSIRKEKLLDITQEDARKEGFDYRLDFLLAFGKINKAPKDFMVWLGNMTLTEKVEYNPDVWVLEFKVI